MKTDRSTSASTRAAAALLVGLLAASPPIASKTIQIGRLKVSVESPSKRLAQALAPEVQKVQERFGENRRALPTVRGKDGKPAYLRQEVAGLITRTGEDLDQAMEKVQPSGLKPLRDWAAEELGRIQGEIAAPARKAAAVPSGLFPPRAVAVVASLREFPLLGLAKGKTAAPQQDTLAAEKAESLLDQVGEVAGRIFLLAEGDDLEVKLWVGSTTPRTTFSFWPQGQVKGVAAAPLIIRTDGKRGGVLRGLYVYRAAYSKGPVTEVIQYPNPAGTPATRLTSERLDLVNGSTFFCCRFSEQYCGHVENEKECRP